MSIASERVLDALRDHGCDVREAGSNQARTRCPAHNGQSNDSLAVTSIEESVLLHCHAGCDKADVLAAIELSMRDLFDNPKGASYPYSDGRVVFRSPEKDFRQKVPKGGDPKGAALFHVERIGDAQLVFVCEGEKDVLAIEAAGGTAVCSAMGASNAHKSNWKTLGDKHVIIVAHKDEAGRKYASDVNRQLIDIAASVSIVQAAVGGDAADHVAAGKTLGEFVQLSIPDPEPEPLTQKVPLPPFPAEAYPDPIADMVAAVAEATQTDPAMAGLSALSSLSACTGGHAEIEIRPGWREPLNVYTVTVAGPGERKSSVQSWMTRPILNVEAQLAAKGIGATLEAETRKQVALKAAELERNNAAGVRTKGPKGTKASADKGAEAADKAMSEAIGAAMAAEAITVPAIPRIVADDVTPEAAASLLAEQGGQMAIISAEAGIFDIIGGRYSKLPNMDLWLKGHSGDQMRVDRKGRPPEYIPRPALTLGLMIQPSVLSAIATNREFRGRGLLARFLYGLPASKVGRRTIAPPPVDPLIEKAYETAVGNLATGMARISDPVILTLTEKASEAMTAIEAAVEPTLAGEGELAQLADWGAKFVGAVARITGMLHLAEHGAEHGPSTPVTATTVLAASRIGTYLKAAAINAFIEMGTDQSTTDACYLLDRVQGLEDVSERELLRTCKRFKARAEMLPALSRLVDHGYLIPLPPAEPTGGRPASPRYRVVGTKGPKATEGAR